MKIALVIGHNNRSKGAYSPALNLSEYDYFKNVCNCINEIDDSIDIYCREPARSYVEEMTPVVQEINKHKYDLVLELHFNASNYPHSRGCECLVHKNSYNGKNIAKYILQMLKKEYGVKIRGTGLIEVDSSNQRGSYGICKTKATYILLEPFFGSNPEEALKFKDYKKFAEFIVRILKA